MRLCTDENEITPFGGKQNLLETLDSISFCTDDEESLIKPKSIENQTEEHLAGNLLQERKLQANNPQIFGPNEDSDEEPELEIEQILELDVPIINYGQFISTKVLGSTL